MAGKPAPPSNEPLCQWHQAPVTLIYQWKIKEGMGVGGGGGWRKHNPKAEQSKWLPWKHCISLQSTWSWCKQGWLCMHHHADCWVLTDNRRWCSLFLTVLNLISFHVFPFESLAMALYWQQDSKEKFWLIKGNLVYLFENWLVQYSLMSYRSSHCLATSHFCKDQEDFFMLWLQRKHLLKSLGMYLII